MIIVIKIVEYRLCYRCVTSDQAIPSCNLYLKCLHMISQSAAITLVGALLGLIDLDLGLNATKRNVGLFYR